MSSVTVLDFINVNDHASMIGCAVPEIAVMPDNFHVARSAKELRVRRACLALRSVLENANFPLGSFCKSAEHTTFGEEDFMHWEACLYLSASLLHQEPYAVAVALSIIRDHLSDYLKNEPQRPVRLALVVEKADRTCKKLVYEGDISSLRTLVENVDKVMNEL